MKIICDKCTNLSDGKCKIHECHFELGGASAWADVPNATAWVEELRGNDQVGGDHYATMPIQPIDFIMENDIGFCEGNVIKYVSRWKRKNGIEDLKKAQYYLDILIANEAGE